MSPSPLMSSQLANSKLAEEYLVVILLYKKRMSNFTSSNCKLMFLPENLEWIMEFILYDTELSGSKKLKSI